MQTRLRSRRQEIIATRHTSLRRRKCTGLRPTYDQLYVLWSELYHTIGAYKDGQYELGSGTKPTILGEGRYVAITDNADPLKVVIFRTDEQLDPNEQRIVCETEVFENQSGGASSNSLIGSRLSLIATNNYYYLFDWKTGKMKEPSAPGVERIDIETT